jgi:LacI family transcriptional regulator
MKKSRGAQRPSLPKVPSEIDVARLAGVSRTQVSYTLNGTGTTHVTAEKRERILAAARELGYHPHQFAQSLRRGFSLEFSIFFPAPYTPLINKIIDTIDEIGLAKGCVVTQYAWNLHRDPERKREAFRAILARRPMGIFCSLLDLDRQDIEEAQARGIERILVLDVERHDDLATFFLPVEEIGRVAATHLLDRGHRRIAVVRPANPVQNRPFRLRHRGMKKAMAHYKDARLAILEWPTGDMMPTLDAARAFVTRFMGSPDRPTAIYAYSDDYALPLMRALRERDVEVPRGVSVLGTDDLAYCELCSPSLSTIRFDSSALGERAVALINSLITGEPPEDRFLQAPIPYVIQREST